MGQGVQITLTKALDFAGDLETKLLRELREKSNQGANESFSLELSDEGNVSLGGLTASTSYGWLLIKVVFIEPRSRGKGLGSELLNAALRHAKTLGCHSAWLDTSDVAAYQFYLAQGFELFGKLSNELRHVPIGHQRWFMTREI